ncbi:regulator of chromosome condensation 1/beta-lactamase-inhibitor protein II [Fimicolochytrium jonesii]|uniref:regulator of chromosome condensation 1/beta-lactamase-inhibitor protein II n=1 Tax=Fimicolochytrium jonesii TaxID=1396493 RepID=UPI0022FE15D9|nr:regulator of chromosome condensation 1/beta-lactamase-inhibitor protein II [Fimicolochytrium jonesii]KAI8821325.1 regulator of chromosome condensation 1/beta-lactamase-inhibitor protein II [Fimicolochytrium jonesii]
MFRPCTTSLRRIRPCHARQLTTQPMPSSSTKPQAPPHRPLPYGSTVTPSTAPSSQHPHMSGYSVKWRLLTFAAGAVVGGLTFALALYNDADETADTDMTREYEETREEVLHRGSLIEAARSDPGLFVWGLGGVEETAATRFFRGKVLRAVALGREQGAAVDEKGNLLQWHVEGSGKASLSRPGRSKVSAPVVTLSGKDLVQVACTGDRVVAVARNGSLYSLQKPAADKGNDGATVKAHTDVRVKAPALWRFESVASIAAGAQHVVAVTTKGRVFTMPLTETANSAGQLGTGVAEERTEVGTWRLVKDLGTDTAAEAACGDSHTLIRTTSGRVFGFGANIFGQLGLDPTNPTFPHPTEITTLRLPSAQSHPATCTQIAAGGNTTLFVLDAPDSTDVLACGSGLNGQLGNGSYTHVTGGPVRVKNVSGLREYDEATKQVKPIRVREIAVSPTGTHCAAVLDNVVDEPTRSGLWWLPWSSPATTTPARYGHDLLLWGGNRAGQLARSDNKKAGSPIPIPVRQLTFGDGEARWKGRFQLAPVGLVAVRSEGGKIRRVRGEGKVVLGDEVTGIFMTQA